MIKLSVVIALAGLATFGADMLTGRVLDNDTGKGMPGLLVTNCDQVTRTGNNGEYTLKRNPKTRFLTVMTPADRSTEGFQIPVVADRDTYDFTLKKQEMTEEFTFVHISDPEIESMPHMPSTIDRFRVFTKNLGASFFLNTGDLHTPDNFRWFKENVNREKWGMECFYTIGNHDHNDIHKNSLDYEANMGSMSYAFQRGNVTFIAFPFYGDYATPADFTQEDICRFIYNILNELPKDKPIMLLSHSPENVSPDGIMGKGTPYEVDLKLWNIKAWFSGHTHRTQTTRQVNGIKLFNSAISTNGAGDEPAGFRYYHVDKNGDVTAAFVNTFAEKAVSLLVSPAPVDGKHLLAAAIEDACSLPRKVTVECKDNSTGNIQTCNLANTGGTQWTAWMPLEDTKNYTLTLKADMNSGEMLIRIIQYPGDKTALPGLKLDYVTTLPGNLTHTAPLAGNGLVFFGSVDDTCAENNGIFALDDATGTVKWFTKTDNSVLNIACMDDRLFAIDSMGSLYAFETAAGKCLWKNETTHPTFKPKNAGQLFVYRGKKTMLICGDRLHTRAVNPEDGKLIWTDSTFTGFIDTPNSKAIVNDILIGTCAWKRYDDQVYAINLETGKILWHINVTEFLNGTILSVTPDNKVLLTSLDCNILLEPEDGTVIARDKENKIYNVISRATFSDGKFFAGLWQGGLQAFDAKTLELAWDARKDFKVQSPTLYASTSYCLPTTYDVQATPVFFKDMIITAALNGTLYAHSTDGNILGMINIGMPLPTTPLLLNGRIFIADSAGRIMAYREAE